MIRNFLNALLSLNFLAWPARLLLWLIIGFLAMTGVRAATIGITVNSTNQLSSKFLPAASAGTQVTNSPAWSDSRTVLGVPTFIEGYETLADAANVTLNWLVGRTKNVTLDQNTVFAFSNVPGGATNIQTMIVQVTGDGASSVAFTGAVWQTPQVTVPDAGTITLYFFRAVSGAVSGYAGIGGSSSGGDTIWDNTAGVISPLGTGQSTNTLQFVSGLADNATNVALVVDTAVPWTGNALLASLGSGGSTNFQFYAELSALVLKGGFAGVSEIYANSSGGALFDLYADATTAYFQLDYGGGNGLLFTPTIISTGSAIAYLFDTSHVLTNGDKLVSIGNAGVEKAAFGYSGTLYNGPNAIAVNGEKPNYVFESYKDVSAGDADAIGFVLGVVTTNTFDSFSQMQVSGSTSGIGITLDSYATPSIGTGFQLNSASDGLFLQSQTIDGTNVLLFRASTSLSAGTANASLQGVTNAAFGLTLSDPSTQQLWAITAGEQSNFSDSLQFYDVNGLLAIRMQPALQTGAPYFFRTSGTTTNRIVTILNDQVEVLEIASNGAIAIPNLDTPITHIDPDAADGTAPYQLGTSITHTSGNLLEVANNGTLVNQVNWDGGLLIGQGITTIDDDYTLRSSHNQALGEPQFNRIYIEDTTSGTYTNYSTFDLSALAISGGPSTSMNLLMDTVTATKGAEFEIALNSDATSSGSTFMQMKADTQTIFKFDVNTTAGNTRFLVWDVDNATLERVSVGVADSGGAGFKVLRIAN